MIDTLDRAETRMPKPKKQQTSIKIDEDIVELLTIIKAATGENMADYVSRVVRPFAVRDCKKAMQQLQKRHVGEGESQPDD